MRRLACRFSAEKSPDSYDGRRTGLKNPEQNKTTMEYVSGIDLFRLVKSVGPLPQLEACNYVLQTAIGLQHAYEQGLVHRDIKPANLMVTPSPLETATSRKNQKCRIKILDMGLARVTDPNRPTHLTMGHGRQECLPHGR